jgi:hypothetical protein
MKNQYVWAAAVGAAAVCAVSPGAARAQNINVTVDGDVVAFTGQRPIQQFGSVLVPLRGVFEKLGASVLYDAGTRRIVAVRGGTNVSLQLGSNRAEVNGAVQQLSVAAQAVNGTTLVPLRFVSEALGARVRWIPASSTVAISTTGEAGGAVAANTPSPATGGASSAATPNANVEVSSLTLAPGDRPVRGGERLTATLHGTPGGAATFTIPGINAARSVAMQETSPGVYTGAFTVPNGVSVKGASVLGSIRVGAASSPVLQAGQPLTIDSVGPQLGSLSPDVNASLAPGKPLVYGTYSDAGTGIDTNGTRLLVNGKDVTGEATVTDAFFSYRPTADLPLGKNTVAVVARDAAGNETRKEWAFTLSAAEALIQQLTVTPQGKTLEPGDEVTVRVVGQPGATARFSLGGTVTDRRMREESPGVYVGTYTIRKGDTLAQAPATVTFRAANGRTVTQSAGEAVTIAAGPPEKPVISTPAADTAAGNAVVVTGKAAPGATVRYSVRYQGSLLILPLSGELADGEVKADAQGNWKTPEITLSAPAGVSKLTYTVSAVTVGAAGGGAVSEPATVQFRR